MKFVKIAGKDKAKKIEILLLNMNRHRFKFAQNRLFFRMIAWLLSLSILLKIRRLMMRFLPFLHLESQATDTVYMSWLVDIDLVKDRFPEPIQLWEKDGKTIFSILFYHHHHFGLHCLGPLRKIFPSPKQSNWRFYLADELVPKTVIFEQIVVDKMLYVFGGRILSDAMPAQYDPHFHHQVKQNDQALDIQAQIEMDATYRLNVHLKSASESALPTHWNHIFKDWDEAIQFFVPQEHVWVECVDNPQKLSQGNIRIVTNFDQIKALKINQIDCPLLHEFNLDPAQPALCFYIPNLDFHVLGEVPVT